MSKSESPSVKPVLNSDKVKCVKTSHIAEEEEPDVEEIERIRNSEVYWRQPTSATSVATRLPGTFGAPQ